MRWDDERDAIVKQKAFEGLSARQCAAFLSDKYGEKISRNAVIGRAHRKGYAFHSGPGGPKGHRPKAEPIPNFWTPFKVAALEVCVAKDMSSYSTAQELGCSRDMVRLRAKRLGLVFKRQGGNPPIRRAKPSLRLVDATPPDLTLAVTVADLEPCHCRFPIWGEMADTLHCGAPAMEDGPYCRTHHKQAHKYTDMRLNRIEKRLARLA